MHEPGTYIQMTLPNTAPKHAGGTAKVPATADATVLPDIKPHTPTTRLNREKHRSSALVFPVEDVAPLVGMAPTFVRKATGQQTLLIVDHVLDLLDMDAFAETFVPRSMVIDYLIERAPRADHSDHVVPNPTTFDVRTGHAIDLLRSVPASTVQCLVTSTPYWGMRVYDESYEATWADGEVCAYGHEQTPEGFLRHTAEVLDAAARVVTDDGSIWWNVMDTFNTRTQIRASAVEALRAMEGKDSKKWADHVARRYSAGHSYLNDGEQVLIPSRIAERASRMGLYVKSVITWAKRSSLPEPQNSRVSRNLEYVLHLSKQRTPKFSRAGYHDTTPELGGRNNGWETEKLSDVWTLSTSSGGDGHGAQFPTALPGRCIALTTEPGDLVVDPFVGSGNSGVAARGHGCAFLGFDVSQQYVATAKEKIAKAPTPEQDATAQQPRDR